MTGTLSSFASSMKQIQKKNSLASYGELKRRVRLTITDGRRRAETVVEREKVRTSWEIGKLIQEHILLNQERANYGERVIQRLSADLGISHTELKYMLQFARTYPIGRTSDQLSWSQVESLLAINEDKKREELIKRAERGNWTVAKTRNEIKRLKAKKEISVSETPDEVPLVPIKGKLDTYRIVIATAGPWKGKPALDLGFSSYLNDPSLRLGRFKEGNIVSTVGANGRAPLRLLKNATPADLFTYRAYPFKIADGDTLWVLVDLGFGVVTQQHLRLRGIDAPEIESRDGKEAKEFLASVIASGAKHSEAVPLRRQSQILIRTSKSDKYDRYLADVWVGETYVNQALIDQGLAVRVNG